MPIPSTPDLLPSPIGGDTLPITATTPSGTGDLSYAQGWPVLTGLPLEAGGVAPQREFFNAVNALVTKHLFFLQSGGVYPWQAALNYLTGWGVLVDGVGYTALQPSGPDVPEVGPKPPAENPEYWGKTKADVPIATTTVPGIMRFATPGEVAAKEEPNAAVSPKDLAGLDGMPVGALLDLYGDDSAAPPGYLLCNGAAVTATYPALRAFGLARGWARNANGDPLLPDSGGYFRRGWRTGQVIDSGRVFGSVQGDAIRNITGAISLHAGTYIDDSSSLGAFSVSETGSDYVMRNDASMRAGRKYTFSAASVVPTGADNHPYSYTCTTWIKAYAAAATAGAIDLANLANDITAAAQRVAALENRLAYTVLYPGGTAAAPATISANQRIVVVNPCGAVPCRVEAEVKISDVWGNSGHYTDGAVRVFVAAHTVDSSIVIQSGATGVATNGSISGSPFGDWGGSASALYRLKIWKLAGA